MTNALEVTPIDEELSRLPLPVLMTGTDFSFGGSNYHHHFHPRKSAELGFDPVEEQAFPTGDERRLPGLATRASRGQHLPIWLHERYHQTFGGPPLPQDLREQFTSVVLACSGIVPRQAIDLRSRGEYRVVDLSPKEHDFIRRRVFFEGAASSQDRNKRSTIGKFIAEYTLENALHHIINERDVLKNVHELLRPRSEEHKRAAGRFILTHAIDASVAELIPIHEEATKARLVQHPRRNLLNIVMRFFPEDRFYDYYYSLAERVSLLAA